MVKDNSKNRINQLRRFDRENTNSKSVNYCTPGIMSRCGAGDTWLRQKRCKFAIKSSVSDRCMYYMESIYGHCDCLEAQLESKKGKNQTE
jgi:hypothetical protein